MRKIFNTVLLIIISLTVYGQESLLLGEIKLDEIQPKKNLHNVETVTIYGMKYKKRGNYKDSIVKGTIEYLSSGLMMENVVFGGKKNRDRYIKKYDYDAYGNIVAYDNMYMSKGGILNRRSTYSYNNENQVIAQEISLANIVYSYFPDGRLKTKSYYYNNNGVKDTEPWTTYFIYDQDKNLIHADTDTSKWEQTSFYNENNQLILHNYYPGIAYSTYRYDSTGNCIRQVDYEKGKKDFDSTVFTFEYNDQGQLTKSSTQNRRGKIIPEKEMFYDEKGQKIAEIFYQRGKPKWLNRYQYLYYERRE